MVLVPVMPPPSPIAFDPEQGGPSTRESESWMPASLHVPHCSDSEGRELAAARRLESSPYARDLLRRDPLLEQLRRISRAASVTTSINDSPAVLRAKLHASAPHQLNDSLHEATSPMFKLQPVHAPPPPAHSMPSSPRRGQHGPPPRTSCSSMATPRMDWMDENARTAQAHWVPDGSSAQVRFEDEVNRVTFEAQQEAMHLDGDDAPAAEPHAHAARHRGGEGDGVERLPQITPRRAAFITEAAVEPHDISSPGGRDPTNPATEPTRQQQQPPQAPPAKSQSKSASPRKGHVAKGGPASGAASGGRGERSVHIEAPGDRRRMASYLGDSKHEMPSAAKYLQDGVPKRDAAAEVAAAEALAAAMKGPNPPSHSIVLSRVIASTERLMLELAHAAILNSADSAKAVEAARLQTLRSHLAALKTVQQQCLQIQQAAEQRAMDLTKQLALTTRERTLKNQENSRLRWALSKVRGGSRRTHTRSTHEPHEPHEPRAPHAGFSPDYCSLLGSTISLHPHTPALTLLPHPTPPHPIPPQGHVGDLKEGAVMAFMGMAGSGKSEMAQKMAQAREAMAFQAQLDDANDLADALSEDERHASNTAHRLHHTVHHPGRKAGATCTLWAMLPVATRPVLPV